MIDLGCMNCWKKNPAIYDKAVGLGYSFDSMAISEKLIRYTCEELGFFFYVDSSSHK